MNFSSVLSEVPVEGNAIIISGQASANAERFRVSLACGKDPNSDVALMLAVDFVSGQITRTSLINGSWTPGEDAENLTSPVSNPILKDQIFIIFIYFGANKFHVSINEQPFCDYDFKLPAKSIRAIWITGDIQTLIEAGHRVIDPEAYPLVPNLEDIAFNGVIPKRYSPGHVVVVTGVPTGSSEGGFIMLFRENDTLRQLVHFNARFDERAVVMNTMNGEEEDTWAEAEVRTETFPFAIDQRFKLAVAFTDSEVKVAANGQHLLDFSYDQIDLEVGQTLFDLMVGFEIKVSQDSNVMVSQVEHIKLSSSCSGFESYTN